MAYDFKCEYCDLEIELPTSKPGPCPRCCLISLKRVWTPPAVIYKATGFYSTDSKTRP